MKSASSIAILAAVLAASAVVVSAQEPSPTPPLVPAGT
eukprot:CAMPEP_0172535156 /NCGR_PEP_ID=MMETSP1067-20121228/7288_1 /TAXON_ID=265564 ORGANISM="Thalassiosira punctigera, Strain Tpunct2005C2" /NCGR_SAMPLE_ID=MMETSP1067 /ASSEMBLY_ACC=CAM_ASM_000444 /LENGTH=37 /DNA_ID= /DNA_START= /DNA_END= /DNA_ORIENTATION=